MAARRLGRSLFVVITIALIGCGSSRTITQDSAADGPSGSDASSDMSADAPISDVSQDGPTGDGAPPDTTAGTDTIADMTPDAGFNCSTAMIGTPCQLDSQCPGGLCLMDAKNDLFPQAGVCSCPCIPAGLPGGDSCPDLANNVCGSLDTQTGTINRCLKKCTPQQTSRPCGAGLVCDPDSSRITNDADTAVCLWSGCTDDQQCVIRTDTICDPSQNGAGGVNPACTANARCFPVGVGNGLCIEAGVCNTSSGLCLSRASKPTSFNAAANVGDPCDSDVDCGHTQLCIQQNVNNNGDVLARNGYCVSSGCAFAATVPDLACTAGATCLRIGQQSICAKTCDIQDAQTCRNHAGDQYGDFECYGFNNLNPGVGPPIATAPVCLPATLFSCADLQNVGVGCNALGVLPANPTNMTCRDLNGLPTISPFDPAGYCLDTTSSGP